MKNLRLVPDFYCTPVIATLHAAATEGREKGICSRHILTVLEHRGNTTSKNHCRHQKTNNPLDDFYPKKAQQQLIFSVVYTYNN